MDIRGKGSLALTAITSLVRTREHHRPERWIGGLDVLHLPRGRPLERRPPGRRVRGRDREYRGVVRVPRRVFQRLLPEPPTPERCVEATSVVPRK